MKLTRICLATGVVLAALITAGPAMGQTSNPEPLKPLQAPNIPSGARVLPKPAKGESITVMVSLGSDGKADFTKIIPEQSKLSDKDKQGLAEGLYKYNAESTLTITLKSFTDAESSVIAAESQAKPKRSGADGVTSAQRGAAGCWSYTVFAGTNLLHGDGSQTWCGDGSYIYYYPKAPCWGDSSNWVPSYAYLSCDTNALYGEGWNQGRTTFSWDLCPGWVPIWGSCVTHDRPRQTVYATPDGYSWFI